MNVTPGRRTAGKNGLGNSNPKARNSQAGINRSAPSTHPIHQSGCAGEVTCCTRKGPYSHTGLICTSPPNANSTAPVMKNRPIDFTAYVGHSFEPTTFD